MTASSPAAGMDAARLDHPRFELRPGRWTRTAPAPQRPRTKRTSMSNYDIAISLDESALGRIVAVLYGRPGLRGTLFQGTQTATVRNVSTTVGWDVQAVPLVRLAPPTDDQWKAAVKADGATAPQPSGNAFILNFPQLRVTRTLDSGEVQDATLPVDVICTVDVRDNQLQLDAQAALVDLSSAPAMDRLFVYPLLIPQVLRMSDSMLSGGQIPDVNFNGLRFGEVKLGVGAGRLVAVAGLPGGPAPDLPDPASLPDGDFYVLLSPAAVHQAASAGAAGLVGKEAGVSGSQGFGVGDASYNANVKVTSADAQPAGDLTSLTVAVGVEVSAGAGVDMLNAIGQQITNAATTVGDGVTDAAKTVGSGLETAGKAAADAFSSY